jgi:hypothetical protein
MNRTPFHLVPTGRQPYYGVSEASDELRQLPRSRWPRMTLRQRWDRAVDTTTAWLRFPVQVARWKWKAARNASRCLAGRHDWRDSATGYQRCYRYVSYRVRVTSIGLHCSLRCCTAVRLTNPEAW